MTLATGFDELLFEGTARLRAAGIDSPQLEARVLLSQAMTADMESLCAGRFANDAEVERFSNYLARRENREPLAYITGTKEFWSLEFFVGPQVLVPRPESETLIEAALRAFPGDGLGLKVLDLGTGSGCLLISFLTERALAHGVGVDISAGAVQMAKRNVMHHALEQRGKIVQLDWADVQETFDVVLCNPPYISDVEFHSLMPDVKAYEPKIALAGGRDGLDAYRQLAPQIAKRLNARGKAFVEIGRGQAVDVATIIRGIGLKVHEIVPDLMQIPRVIAVSAGQ